MELWWERIYRKINLLLNEKEGKKRERGNEWGRIKDLENEMEVDEKKIDKRGN